MIGVARVVVDGAAVGGPSRRAWPAAPAESAPGTIERAAKRIAAVRRRHSIAAAREIGTIIVEDIYHRDVTSLRSKGPKDDSLRKLAAHPMLTLSAATLWRSVGVALLCKRLPEFCEPRHVSLAHLYAVLGLREQEQARLLRLADSERWPRAKLEAEAEALRPTRGRASQPKLLRRIAQLHRIATSLLPDADGPLGDDAIDELETALTHIERWSSDLRQKLAAMRRRTGDVSR